MTTPAAVDDLKGFDVPDPPKPAGWKLRCLLSALVGLALAAGLVRAVRLPHLVWVAEHHTRRWDTDRLGYVQARVLEWLDEGYDADTLRPYALAMTDPKVRGRLHRALAGSKDPAQLDAMLAYLRCMDSWDFDREAPGVVDSMLALDRAQAIQRLLKEYEEPSRKGELYGSYGGTFDGWVAKTLEEKVQPADLAPHVTKLADPEKRGRFHAALATTKDPAQLDAVMAYARTVLPTSPGASKPEQWGPIVASLGAFGPVATPKLEAVLEQTESRSLVSLAAEALRTSDLEFLIKRARALLDEYDEGVPALIRQFQLVSAAEEDQLPEDVTQEQLAAAREAVERASARAFMIFEVLRSLEAVKGNQAVDFCIVRGLSTFDRQIAEWCALRIKERFTPDQLIDTLFSYIAQKTQFAVAEVDVYEGLMKDLGPPGARRVAQNLDRLITEAQGDPEEVFWLYKKMGFTLLGELGTADAIPTLEKYAADPGSYVLTSTRTDGMGRKTRTQEEIGYADAVRKAIAAIEARMPERGGE